MKPVLAGTFLPRTARSAGFAIAQIASSGYDTMTRRRPAPPRGITAGDRHAGDARQPGTEVLDLVRPGGAGGRRRTIASGVPAVGPLFRRRPHQLSAGH